MVTGLCGFFGVLIVFFFLPRVSWYFICGNSLRPGLKLCSSRESVHLPMLVARNCYQPETNFKLSAWILHNTEETWIWAENLHKDLQSSLSHWRLTFWGHSNKDSSKTLYPGFAISFTVGFLHQKLMFKVIEVEY